MSAKTQKEQKQKSHTKQNEASSSNHTPLVKQKNKQVQSSIPYHKILSGVFWVCIAGLFILMAFNIIASQLVHPMYFSFINEDRETVISFLEKSRSLDSYPQIQENLSRSIEVLEEDIQKNDVERQQTITELEQVLEKNQKARDVLVALSVLYEQGGNEQKAEEYWERAREVDPGLNSSITN